MINHYVNKIWESPFVHKFESSAKKILIQTAKDGLAGSVIGYCVCQLSGANPSENKRTFRRGKPTYEISWEHTE